MQNWCDFATSKDQQLLPSVQPSEILYREVPQNEFTVMTRIEIGLPVVDRVGKPASIDATISMNT